MEKLDNELIIVFPASMAGKAKDMMYDYMEFLPVCEATLSLIDDGGDEGRIMADNITKIESEILTALGYGFYQGKKG